MNLSESVLGQLTGQALGQLTGQAYPNNPQSAPQTLTERVKQLLQQLHAELGRLDAHAERLLGVCPPSDANKIQPVPPPGGALYDITIGLESAVARACAIAERLGAA